MNIDSDANLYFLNQFPLTDGLLFSISSIHERCLRILVDLWVFQECGNLNHV